MRLLTLVLLFCLYSTSNAQDAIKSDKPVSCFPTSSLLSTLKETYNEEPIILGQHAEYKDTITAVYVNLMAGTYTVIEMDKNIACIVSIGTELQLRKPKNGPSL